MWAVVARLCANFGSRNSGSCSPACDPLLLRKRGGWRCSALPCFERGAFISHLAPAAIADCHGWWPPTAGWNRACCRLGLPKLDLLPWLQAAWLAAKRVRPGWFGARITASQRMNCSRPGRILPDPHQIRPYLDELSPCVASSLQSRAPRRAAAQPAAGRASRGSLEAAWFDAESRLPAERGFFLPHTAHARMPAEGAAAARAGGQ